MKTLLMILIAGVAASMMVSCESPMGATNTTHEKVTTHGKVDTTARVTYYNKHEDHFGSRIAIGGRAKEGITVAMENSIPYGAKVQVATLKGIVGNGEFIKQDTGRDVRNRKASRGKLLVVDVYVATRRKYNWLVSHMPPVMPVSLVY